MVQYAGLAGREPDPAGDRHGPVWLGRRVAADMGFAPFTRRDDGIGVRRTSRKDVHMTGLFDTAAPSAAPFR
ncbi:hypothetical protein GCM10010360_16020 [Streptomyces nogalater]